MTASEKLQKFTQRLLDGHDSVREGASGTAVHWNRQRAYAGLWVFGALIPCEDLGLSMLRFAPGHQACSLRSVRLTAHRRFLL